jgi:hypothetical protein
MIGRFNPTIFQPKWLLSQQLIRQSLAESAKGKLQIEGDTQLKIVHPSVTAYSTDSYHIQVTPEQYVISSVNSDWLEELRDLTVGIFRTLNHTPIYKMGINQEWHFKAIDNVTYKSIMSKYIPSDPWSNLVKNPSPISVQIASEREDEYKGSVVVRAERSNQVKNGIYLLVNDHYDLVEEPEEHIGCEEAIKALESVFKDSIRKTTAISTSMMSRT